MAKRGRKAAAGLDRRRRGWEAIKADGSLHGGKVKYDHGYAYREPGSQKK